MSIRTTYQTVIGLEAHIQLATESKAFCGDAAAFAGEPNTRVGAVSLGLPGTLPRLNERQIELAVRLGLALGCRIERESTFDRKNYFYADLPKGYQITQDRRPICVGGALPIRLPDGTRKDVRLHHIHMEEDAGKSIHDQDPAATLVDLNRAGTPLLEVVTEPDLRSPEEVDAFMTAMRRLVRYLGISDGNMQEGSLRCDVNISIMPVGATEYGQRCEVKNLNSMRFARRAIDYEVKRQAKLLDAGGRVRQQTRQFDPVTGTTSALRDKEDAHDYRYFPDPDLPPVLLTAAYVEAERAALPELPWEIYDRLRDEYGLSDYDAGLIYEDAETAAYYKVLTAAGAEPKAAANLLINQLLPACRAADLAPADLPVPAAALVELLSLIDAGKVAASTATGQLLTALLEEPAARPAALAAKLGLIQSADTDFLADLAEEVLAAFPDKVAAYRKGKRGLLGFFMGEVMKRSKGKAEPKATQALLVERLEH